MLAMAGAAIQPTGASREMLLNQPLPGDAMLLVQPTYEYSRRGPQTLRYLHRYAKSTLENRIATGGGKDPEKDKDANGVGGMGMSWEEASKIPPVEPFPKGMSESRVLNYGMVSYHSDVST